MKHLTNPQAQRTLKLVTAVACTSVGLSTMLFSDYDHVEGFEGKEHIFSNIQKDARDFFDRNVYGIDPDAIRRKAAEDAKSKAAANAGKPEAPAASSG